MHREVYNCLCRSKSRQTEQRHKGRSHKFEHTHLVKKGVEFGGDGSCASLGIAQVQSTTSVTDERQHLKNEAPTREF